MFIISGCYANKTSGVGMPDNNSSIINSTGALFLQRMSAKSLKVENSTTVKNNYIYIYI